MNSTNGTGKNESGKIHMIISDGETRTYYCRSELYNKGFRFIRKDEKWHRDTTDPLFVEKYRDYAKRNGLAFVAYDSTRTRCNSYRDTFFEANEPMIGKYYVCAYCFKLLKKNDVTVDHIISVNKSQKNRMANWLMDRMGISNVNDERNLCCACRECNSRKGSKAGLWLLRGFLGKKKQVIWGVYIGTIAMLIILIGTVIQILSNS